MRTITYLQWTEEDMRTQSKNALDFKGYKQKVLQKDEWVTNLKHVVEVGIWYEKDSESEKAWQIVVDMECANGIVKHGVEGIERRVCVLEQSLLLNVVFISTSSFPNPLTPPALDLRLDNPAAGSMAFLLPFPAGGEWLLSPVSSAMAAVLSILGKCSIFSEVDATVAFLALVPLAATFSATLLWVLVGDAVMFRLVTESSGRSCSFCRMSIDMFVTCLHCPGWIYGGQ